MSESPYRLRPAPDPDGEAGTVGPSEPTKTVQLPTTARQVSQPSTMEEDTAHPHVPARPRRRVESRPALGGRPVPTKGQSIRGAALPASSISPTAPPERRVHFDLTHGDWPPPKRSPDPVLDQVLAERAVRAKIAATEAAHAQSPTAAAVTTAEDEAILAPIIAQMARDRDMLRGHDDHFICDGSRAGPARQVEEPIAFGPRHSTQWRNMLLLSHARPPRAWRWTGQR